MVEPSQQLPSWQTKQSTMPPHPLTENHSAQKTLAELGSTLTFSLTVKYPDFFDDSPKKNVLTLFTREFIFRWFTYSTWDKDITPKSLESLEYVTIWSIQAVPGRSQLISSTRREYMRIMYIS